jgi:hypothetical protein
MTLPIVGAVLFGIVIGWITYRTLRRKEGASALSDIATVIGAIGGAAIVAIFKTEDLFAAYSIGLAIGFFAYLLISIAVYGKDQAGPWMGD